MKINKGNCEFSDEYKVHEKQEPLNTEVGMNRNGQLNQVGQVSENAEAELLRNTLSVRWSDAEHTLVADTAWQRRTSCSQLIRELVMEGLGKEGVKVSGDEGNQNNNISMEVK